PIFRVVRDLGHPDPLANGSNLLADARPRIRAMEGDLLDRFEPLLLKPQRVLQPEGRAPDGIRGCEPIVDRCGEERPAGPQLLVRERDLEPALVVLLDLRVRITERRVIAEPG